MALAWVQVGAHRLKHGAHQCVCVCCMLNAKEWKRVGCRKGSKLLNWKDKLSWAADSHCPWMPRKLVWRSAEISLFLPPSTLFSQGVGVCCMVLPLLCSFSFSPDFLFCVSCFWVAAAFPLFVSSSNCQGKKKPKPPKTFCKLTLLSITDADAYPDGNSALFALFKPTPLHTWCSFTDAWSLFTSWLVYPEMANGNCSYLCLDKNPIMEIDWTSSLSFSLAFTLFSQLELFNLQLI